ncbi:DNA methyltransferase [Escherichia coli]
MTVQVPYTDVWMHKPVQYYPDIVRKTGRNVGRYRISASSRPGDLVADFFMGSGSTVKAAMALDVVQLALSWRLSVLSRRSGKFRI